MDSSGQIYFDEPENIPEADIKRMRDAIIEDFDSRVRQIQIEELKKKIDADL